MPRLLVPNGTPPLVWEIRDLPGDTLGFASGNTICLDTNAAGWGWFIDLPPADDSEFYAPGNQGEQDRMDLFTDYVLLADHLFSLASLDPLMNPISLRPPRHSWS